MIYLLIATHIIITLIILSISHATKWLNHMWRRVFFFLGKCWAQLNTSLASVISHHFPNNFLLMFNCLEPLLLHFNLTCLFINLYLRALEGKQIPWLIYNSCNVILLWPAVLKDKKVGFYDNIYLVYYTKYFACQQANCYSSLIRTTKYCPNWLDIFDTFCLLHHLNKNIDNMELSQWLYFFKCFSFLLPLRRSAKKIKIKNVEVGLILKEHRGELRKEHSVMETCLLSVLPAQGAVKACQGAQLPRTTQLQRMRRTMRSKVWKSRGSELK